MKARDEYTFNRPYGWIESWRKTRERDDTLATCRNCSELTKPGQMYCSFYCRAEFLTGDN